ncbi:hypothetical protein POVWA2_039070 [Plasmodium ovale wallikeri]|uniref:Uncharacterized protein n=1 Tax=Plasmodium ovale wallikeri TaxID=864142 RepID=A0A1A8Z8D9_PLAOA|nr:hypothetical protein POVWA1_040300 [Plasmodium ovale wallikeri]SBT40122.1 hypothetical protein POVWA2_039070 [Plasmodium ovale wallikeri]
MCVYFLDPFLPFRPFKVISHHFIFAPEKAPGQINPTKWAFSSRIRTPSNFKKHNTFSFYLWTKEFDAYEKS